MRSLTSRLSLSALLTLSLAACDNTDNGAGAGTLSATVAGAGFTTAVTQGSLSGGVLSVGGSSVGNPPRQITIGIVGAAAGQTYAVGASGVTAVWTEGTAQTDSYVGSIVSGGGEVVVETLSAEGASGTFSFVGQNTAGQTRAVTDGAFSVTF